MKISQKVLVAPAVAIAFLLVLGALAYIVQRQQSTVLEELTNDRFSAYQVAADSENQVAVVHSNVYRLLTWIANFDEAKIKQVADAERARIDEVTRNVTRFAALPSLTDEERKLLGKVLPELSKYRKAVDVAIDISSVDVSTGVMSMQTADTQFQALLKDFAALVQLEKQLSQQSSQQAAAYARRAVEIVLALLAIAVVMSIGIALYMSRSIVRPLRVAIAAADQVASGDLSHDIAAGGTDETGQLLQSLDTMSRSLRTLVGEVAGGAQTVADTSGQIAQGNLDLSQRTEEQASTLEETASSLEELTSTVTQNAHNARQASELALSASGTALKGGRAVGDVVNTMTGIAASSKKIADIISVIDGIAFQTNILALNAAVEAARAGEQGRGFAVVATEVRNLAQRSATAAKEIKTLIGESVEKVDAGTKQVAAAGATMEEIVGCVKRVSDLIAEIAAACQEQSSGIGQVNTAVLQMDQVVQQNASLVEEATAATESMKEQARSLLQMVSRFKIGNERATTAVAVAPASAGWAAIPLRRHPTAPDSLPVGPALVPLQVRPFQA